MRWNRFLWSRLLSRWVNLGNKFFGIFCRFHESFDFKMFSFIRPLSLYDLPKIWKSSVHHAPSFPGPTLESNWNVASRVYTNSCSPCIWSHTESNSSPLGTIPRDFFNQWSPASREATGDDLEAGSIHPDPAPPEQIPDSIRDCSQYMDIRLMSTRS